MDGNGNSCLLRANPNMQQSRTFLFIVIISFPLGLREAWSMSMTELRGSQTTVDAGLLRESIIGWESILKRLNKCLLSQSIPKVKVVGTR